MTWLRAIPFLFTLLAFVLQPASASAFGNAHPEARVSAFELVALASVGASAETSPGLHEGIAEAYDENASGYRFAAKGGGPKTLDDLLEGATPGRTTKGRSTQFDKPGGFERANADFDALSPTDVRALEGGGRVGTLPDGRTVIVRPTSKSGAPTLEVQKGKNRTKIRFGD